DCWGSRCCATPSATFAADTESIPPSPKVQAQARPIGRPVVATIPIPTRGATASNSAVLAARRANKLLGHTHNPFVCCAATIDQSAGSLRRAEPFRYPASKFATRAHVAEHTAQVPHPRSNLPGSPQLHQARSRVSLQSRHSSGLLLMAVSIRGRISSCILICRGTFHADVPKRRQLLD